MSGNEKALIYKDINEITSSRRVIMPMTIVPIIMVVVIPIAILIGAKYIGNDSSMFTKMAPLLKKLPYEYTTYTPAQLLIKITVNFMFPSYFLIIPKCVQELLEQAVLWGKRSIKLWSLCFTHQYPWNSCLGPRF